MLKLIPLSRIAAVALIAAVPALVTNCRSVVFSVINVPSYVGSYQRHADIRYGDLPRQSLDIYTPPPGTARRPIVMFWYGGGWTKGRKEQYRFVGAALANAGYVAVLPDYRLFPDARFPQFIDDGALAVKWARDHASEFGGDPQAMFLMGHSAGAHLAATLALDERYLKKVGGDAEWVRAWIALSAPYELKRMHAGMYTMFKAHAPAEWRPISLVSSRAPPALLVHGFGDGTIDPEEVLDMEDSMHRAGVSVECRIYSVGHMGTALAFSPAFRVGASVLADVQGFIDRTVNGAAVSSVASCPDVRGRRHGNFEHPPARPDLLEIP